MVAFTLSPACRTHDRLSGPPGNFSKNEGHELTLAASIMEKGYKKGRPFRVALWWLVLLTLLSHRPKSDDEGQ